MVTRRELRPAPGPAALSVWLGVLLLGLAELLGGCGDGARAAGEPAADRDVRGLVPSARPRATEPPAAAEVGPPPRRLEAEVRRVVSRAIAEAGQRSKGVARASNVTVGVHALLFGRGEVVALDADRSMRPASNLKLVTTAALLVLCGTGTSFQTPVEAGGPLEGGVLQGDLIVRAGGDPFCRADGSGAVEERFDALAGELRALGLRRVTGDLVLDEGTFLEPGPGPAWPDPSQHWAEYCALSGGFTVNGGVLQARVTPGAVGRPARIEVHPAPHGLESRYGVVTSSGRLDVRVGATVSAVTVKGELPAGRDPYVAEFSHPDPRGLFGAVLRGALQRAGITVQGGLRAARDVPPGTYLAALRSPVDEVLGPINADSRNGVADQLFLALGQAVTGEGTRTGGRRATALALRQLGVPVDGLVQVDGSGLSRDNRVSPRQITALLAAVLGRRGEPEAELYRRSLAVMGERGTLEDRLRGTAAAGRVFGKTGWIRGTSALSGTAERPDGGLVVFSILVDYPAQLDGLNTHCFKPMQDELVTLFLEAGL